MKAFKLAEYIDHTNLKPNATDADIANLCQEARQHLVHSGRTVGPNFGVKAAGGIGDYTSALHMIGQGANRLGMSRTVAVLEEAKKRERSST